MRNSITDVYFYIYMYEKEDYVHVFDTFNMKVSLCGSIENLEWDFEGLVRCVGAETDINSRAVLYRMGEKDYLVLDMMGNTHKVSINEILKDKQRYYNVYFTSNNKMRSKEGRIIEIPSSVLKKYKVERFNNKSAFLSGYKLNTIVRMGTNELILTSVDRPSRDDANVGIPDCVDELHGHCFDSISCKTISIGNGVKTIPPYAFYKTKADKVIMSDAVTSIRNNAFMDSYIGEIEFSSRIKVIEEKAFYRCKCQCYVFESELASIGDYAFYHSSATYIDIWDTKLKILCENELTGILSVNIIITLPKCIETLNTRALPDYSRIKEIRVPDKDITVFGDKKYLEKFVKVIDKI